MRTAAVRVGCVAQRGPLALAASLAIALLPLYAGTAAAASAGAMTEFPTGLGSGSAPSGITPGANGNLWFAIEGTTHEIGQITPGGTITVFSAGLNSGSKPRGITTGPDGNLWFTDRGTTPAIGQITTSGTITEFSAGLNSGTEPRGIAPGADGNLWFTDSGSTPAIGRITTSGTITEFSPWLTEGSVPWEIAAGPDGNLWFTDIGKTRAIGQITPSAAITEFSAGLSLSSIPVGITLGPDGNLWFTDIGNTPAIGQITPAGAITEYSAGLGAKSGPVTIAPGADGNVWFADQGSTPAIGQIGAGAAAASASAPAISGNDRVGAAQLCNDGTWSSWASLQPSTSLYAFDGYRWLLGGFEVAAGQSYTPVAANLGAQLSCQVTVTYPLLDVTTAATSAPVTVAPPMPVITDVRQSARSWREGSKLARVSRSKHSGPPVGTTISFVSDEPASVSFGFAQLLPGRTVAKTCVAKTKSNAAHKTCVRASKVAALPFKAASGANKVIFQGRVSARKRLAVGRYTLTITATNSAGVSSAPQSLSFAILK